MNIRRGLTYEEAVARATDKAFMCRRPFIVLKRTAHPAYLGQTVYLVVREADLHTLSADSTVVHTTDPHSQWRPISEPAA